MIPKAQAIEVQLDKWENIKLKSCSIAIDLLLDTFLLFSKHLIVSSIADFVQQSDLTKITVKRSLLDSKG